MVIKRLTHDVYVSFAEGLAVRPETEFLCSPGSGKLESYFGSAGESKMAPRSDQNNLQYRKVPFLIIYRAMYYRLALD